MNIISNNQFGIKIDYIKGSTGALSTIFHNEISGNLDYGIYYEKDRDAKIKLNAK